MAKQYSFRELRIWKNGMDLCRMVYRATDGLPSHENFVLRSQIRKAAVSVPSNIAEGWGRSGRNTLRQFCLYSRGSLCEVETQIQLCFDLSYIDESTKNDVLVACDELAASIFRFIESIPSTEVRENQTKYGAEREDTWFSQDELFEMTSNPLL